MLGDENIAAIADGSSLRYRLAPGMSLLQFEGGAIIRTGLLPEWGDATNDIIPPNYKIAATLIKPIRFNAYKWGIMNVPEPLDYTEESLKWLRRFD